tara:strand:- start:160 stop:624 length:465 start_codon:yes stop_codon:yes gene_type:complete
MDYIKNKEDKNKGCVFCLKSKQKDDRENLVLFRGSNSFVLMNLYPYNNGHIMVCPYDHIDTTKFLSNESMTEIMMLADKSMDIFRNSMNAQGFNFGANIGISGGAGIADHIHFHVVPRWLGDTNFMPVLGHTKVMVDELINTYDKLKIEFDKIK